MADDLILLGCILGAHGVRGAVRIKSFCADPAAIATYGPLQDRGGQRHFHLQVIGRSSGAVLAQIDGIADRDAANTLKGVELFVPRAALPPAEDGEYYQTDLIGLTAMTPDGQTLGQVVGVLSYGQGDMLEIMSATLSEPLVIPFTDESVPSVDLAHRRLVVAPPAGLLETPDRPARSA